MLLYNNNHEVGNISTLDRNIVSHFEILVNTFSDILQNLIQMDDKINIKIGEKISELRTSKGLSQAAFGKSLGVGQTQIANIENNVRGVSANGGVSEYAVETEFAHKWAESVGQCLYYSKITGKKPAVAIILKKPTDYRYIRRINKENKSITIFKIQAY